jgi:hypothetical protein
MPARFALRLTRAALCFLSFLISVSVPFLSLAPASCAAQEGWTPLHLVARTGDVK